MAWIYFRELVGLASLSGRGFDQSPIVNLTDIVRVSYCHECDRVQLVRRQYGTMCEVSKAKCYPMGSTSYMADSHVKISVPQESDLVSKKDNEAGYGKSLLESFAKLDQVTFFWKTPATSGCEDSISSSVTLPKWGWMQNGELFRLAPWVLHTHEKECSFWPTPRASMGKSGWGHGRVGNGRYRRSVIERCNKIGWTPSGEMQEAVQGYPIGWTVLEHWATAWFRSKRAKRSKY